jgi:3-phosphoshikimate 1-carboxyvinyltransferase
MAPLGPHDDDTARVDGQHDTMGAHHLGRGDDAWPAPYAGGPVIGSVRVPGSKSMTNRHLVLGALAEGVSTLRHPLVSRDSTLMREALAQLGARFSAEPEDLAWHVGAPESLKPAPSIDAGLAGTVMRFLPPVAALARGETTFDGDAQARTRPVGPLLSALAELGVRITSSTEAPPAHLPFSIHGSGAVRGGQVDLDASASSQFVSALLLAGARFDRGLTLRHVGAALPSRPHIEMTLQALARVGVQAGEVAPATWRVEPGPIQPLAIDIEPDLSSAAPFLALATISSGQITVDGWPRSTTQAGDALPSILTEMGATAEVTDAGLRLTGPPPGTLRGIEVDLHDVGELTPVVAAVAALAHTPSRLYGVAHLRGHETDRLHALQTELTRLGGEVEASADALLIRPAPLHGAVLRTYHDHRMAMAAAVLGAGVPGVQVQDVATTAKTFPGFAAVWSRLVHPDPAAV